MRNNNNFQRIGSKSNAGVGKEFERIAKKYFLDKESIELKENFSINIGVSNVKSKHCFDLGIADSTTKILVECKSHKWTKGENIPSAKLTIWNEAMYYFFLSPSNFKKIFFILRDYSKKKKETLGAYYLRRYSHLVPLGVKFYEYNEKNNEVKILN